MANLLGQNIGTNYKGILNLNTLNGNLSGTLESVTDGDGNASPLRLSTGEVGVNRTIALGAGSSNVRLINETYTINNSGAQTGTATGIFLNATETALNGMTHNLMDLQVGGSSVFRVTRAGSINAAGGNFVVDGGYIQGAASWKFNWAGRARISSPSSTNILLENSSENGFNLLQFGGTTNLFPALKRNGAALEVRLADDSGFANLTANVIRSTDGTSNGVIITPANRTDISINAGLILSTRGSGLRVASSAGEVTASAQFEVFSTTQGFLPPRMTTAQRDAIATPAAGLMVYNTSTNRPNFYDGSAWVAL